MLPEKTTGARATYALTLIGGLLFIAIVVISAIEVGMRYLLGAPTIWAHEWSVLLAAVAFVLGGPVVHRQRQHIAITFLHERLPAPVRRRVDVVSSVLILVCLSLLALAAWRQAWLAISTVERSGTALNLPLPMVLKTLFALCVLVMALQTVGHLIADVRTWRSPRDIDSRA